MKEFFYKGILLCMLLMLFGSMASVHAASGSCGDNVSWTLENGILTISGSGEMTEYEEIDAVPWREMRDEIKEIVVEEGITYLGKWCFYDLDSLQSISLPNTLRSTGHAVIHDCASLTELVLPEGLEELGFMCVSQCESLTHLTIPSTLTTIDDEVFTELPSIQSITVAPGNSTLLFKDSLLIDVTTMTVASGTAAHGDVAIPEGIQYIKSHAFMCNPYITSVSIPEGVVKVGGMAFYRCENLQEVYLPASLEGLAMYAFHRSENIQKIGYAGNESQWNAISRPDYGDDESLSRVESLLQYGVPVPQSLTTMGQATEAQVPTGTTEFMETTPTTEDEVGVEFYDIDSGACGDGLTWCLTSYEDKGNGESGTFLSIDGTGDMWDYGPNNFAPWSAYIFDQISVGEGVTSIGDYAFYRGCEMVDVVFLHGGITYFGENCMVGCTKVEVIFYSGTLEQWQQATVEEENDVLFSKLCYYAPEEDTYYPLNEAPEVEGTPQVSAPELETAVPAVSQSAAVTASQTEESSLSPMLILIIVALVVLVIAIATSTTVIIMVLKKNKQAQAAQTTQPAAAPPEGQQQYGFTQNSRYDPYSQYHQNDDK